MQAQHWKGNTGNPSYQASSMELSLCFAEILGDTQQENLVIHLCRGRK